MTDAEAADVAADKALARSVVNDLGNALAKAFPGAAGKVDSNTRWGEVEGVNAPVGQTCTLILIQGHAVLVVSSEDRDIVITLTHDQVEHMAILPASGLPVATDEAKASGPGWRDTLKRARSKAVVDAAVALVAPILKAEWLTLNATVEQFSGSAAVATLYADYHGDRVVFDHVTDCGPSRRFRIISSSSSGGTWLGDVPPVDGQECWGVVSHHTPAIHACRLRRSDRGQSGDRIFVVEVLDGSGGRPNFSPEGALMVPQGKPTTTMNHMGVFVPRNPTTDRLAASLTMALNMLDNAKARNTVIEAAFGDVLKTALTDAVARVDDAALKLDKASEKIAASGPINGVGGLLDD